MYHHRQDCFNNDIYRSIATDIKLNASGTPFPTTLTITNTWHVMSSTTNSHGNSSRITGVRPATTYIAHTSRIIIGGNITMDDNTLLTIADILVDTPSFTVLPAVAPVSYFTGTELHLQGFVALPGVINIEKTIPTIIEPASTVAYVRQSIAHISYDSHQSSYLRMVLLIQIDDNSPVQWWSDPTQQSMVAQY